MLLYTYVLFLITLILGIFAVFFTVQFYNIIFHGFAPLVSTGKNVMDRILDNLTIKDGAKVYELGCGKATFLRSAEKKFPKAEYFGVEYSFLPFVVTETQLALTDSKIKVEKENIFKTDLEEADIIYCYLNIKTMAELEKKFSAECKPGTQIISYRFHLPNKKEDKVLEIDKNSKVYFYTL